MKMLLWQLSEVNVFYVLYFCLFIIFSLIVNLMKRFLPWNPVWKHPDERSMEFQLVSNL